jgi:Immunoglobulin-like domain of bacterial spore germination
MTDVTPDQGTEPGGPSRRGLLLGIGALVAVLAIALAVYLITRDDGGSEQTATTSTSTSPTTTTAAPTTTVPPTTVPVDTSTAVWPFASSATRYSDPVSAARAFATDYVGFTNPVVGEFRQGDAQSGEVPVQGKATGPVTTVIVRQFGGTWWVLGASTPNIQLTSPAALSVVSSPIHLQGTSTAFEATVNTSVRADGSTQPIGTGIVMGGASGELGPFDGSLPFTTPGATAGAVTLLTLSAEDGSVSEATVVRVKFA